jgi:carbon-monoxide dehydrogenase medium subunit
MLKHVTPGTLEEALELLADDDSAQPLAGGSDVMIQLARRELQPRVLVSLDRLAGLRAVTHADRPVLGALLIHERLATDPWLRARYACLCEAADQIGGWQTKVVGTLGGNVCNASPAADLAPGLLVHGAVVELVSRARGARSVPLAEFLLGRRQTARKADELLTHVELDPVPLHTGSAYRKVGRRSSMEVACVGIAACVTLDADGDTLADVRIAACAVGPTARRMHKVESILTGATLTTECVAEAGQALLAEASPIDDARASRAYRLAVMPRLLADVLTTAVRRATERTQEAK